MKVALVTTCLNEAAHFADWQRDVLGQRYQPNEISIVDAGSSDGTLPLLMSWAQSDGRVRLEVCPKCTVAQGRNRAIRNTTADVIVSTDMGCRLEVQWCEALVAPFLEDPSIMVVAGNYVASISTAPTPVARAACYYTNNYAARLGHDNFLPSSRSISYRRVVWEQLSGYPEDLSYAADDTVFALQIKRAGFKTAYAVDAVCRWGRYSTLGEYWAEAFRYARGNGQALIYVPKLVKRYPHGVPRILTFLYALYGALIGGRQAVVRALRNRDILGALYIPILLGGCRIRTIGGYEAGVREGAVQCLECRRRLNAPRMAEKTSAVG